MSSLLCCVAFTFTLSLLSITNGDDTVNNVTSIDIYIINSLSSGSGKTISGAQYIAINEINNNPNILPNYKFNLIIYDTEGDSNIAMQQTLNILRSTDYFYSSSQQCYQSSNTSNSSSLMFPILLGVSRSSFSTLIASVLNSNYLGLMSAVSTSITLSDLETYPYFYRTISSDSLQSKGI